MLVNTFSLPQLLDLALKVPEVGAVNFNILHTILEVLIRENGLSRLKPWCNVENPSLAQITLTTLKLGPSSPLRKSVSEPVDMSQVVRRSVPVDKRAFASESATTTLSSIEETEPVLPVDLQTELHLSVVSEPETLVEDLQQESVSKSTSLKSSEDTISSESRRGEPTQVISEVWRATNVNRRLEAVEEGLAQISYVADKMVDRLHILDTSNSAIQEMVEDIRLKYSLLFEDLSHLQLSLEKYMETGETKRTKKTSRIERERMEKRKSLDESIKLRKEEVEVGTIEESKRVKPTTIKKTKSLEESKRIQKSKKSEEIKTGKPERIELDKGEESQEIEVTEEEIIEPEEEIIELDKGEESQEIEVSEEEIIEPEEVESEKGIVVEPEKRKVVEPAKRKVAEPAKEKVVESEKGEELEPAKRKVVKPAKGKVVESEKGEVLEPEKRKVVEPAKEKVVESEMGEVLEPEKRKVVESEKEIAVKPEKRKVVGPEKGKVVELEEEEIEHVDDKELERKIATKREKPKIPKEQKEVDKATKPVAEKDRKVIDEVEIREIDEGEAKQIDEGEAREIWEEQVREVDEGEAREIDEGVARDRDDEEAREIDGEAKETDEEVSEIDERETDEESIEIDDEDATEIDKEAREIDEEESIKIAEDIIELDQDLIKTDEETKNIEEAENPDLVKTIGATTAYREQMRSIIQDAIQAEVPRYFEVLQELGYCGKAIRYILKEIGIEFSPPVMEGATPILRKATPKKQLIREQRRKKRRELRPVKKQIHQEMLMKEFHLLDETALKSVESSEDKEEEKEEEEVVAETWPEITSPVEPEPVAIPLKSSDSKFLTRFTDIWDEMRRLSALTIAISAKQPRQLTKVLSNLEKVMDDVRKLTLGVKELEQKDQDKDISIKILQENVEYIIEHVPEKGVIDYLVVNKADKAEVKSKVDRFELVNTASETSDTLNCMAFNFREFFQLQDKVNEKIINELKLRLTADDFQHLQQPTLNRLQALMYGYKNLKGTVLKQIFPEASTVIKCASCSRPAHFAAPKSIFKETPIDKHGHRKKSDDLLPMITKKLSHKEKENDLRCGFGTFPDDRDQKLFRKDSHLDVLDSIIIDTDNISVFDDPPLPSKNYNTRRYRSGSIAVTNISETTKFSLRKISVDEQLGSKIQTKDCTKEKRIKILPSITSRESYHTERSTSESIVEKKYFSGMKKTTSFKPAFPR